LLPRRNHLLAPPALVLGDLSPGGTKLAFLVFLIITFFIDESECLILLVLGFGVIAKVFRVDKLVIIIANKIVVEVNFLIILIYKFLEKIMNN
jgi:hypothetical protein